MDPTRLTQQDVDRISEQLNKNAAWYQSISVRSDVNPHTGYVTSVRMTSRITSWIVVPAMGASLGAGIFFMGPAAAIGAQQLATLSVRQIGVEVAALVALGGVTTMSATEIVDLCRQ
jgi:hypothetical protein